MGTQITPTGVKFPEHDIEQTAPVVSVNSTTPDDSGNIEVAAGGGATYTSQDYHASTDFLFKDSKWYGGHVVYSYSTNASVIENLSVGSVLHEVSSGLPLSVVSIDAAANRITLNRGDFVDLGTSNRVLEDRENSTFSGTTFTYVSGAGNSLNCTNIWLQVKGNENHANTTTLPTTNNSVANLPMKLDHLPSMATHIIFRVSSETGGSFKIYNRETFNTRPADAELLPSEIVHQIDIEGSGTQSGFSEFRVPINSYFRFWVTGGAKANLYPVGYSVLDLSEIDLQSASNPVITDLETRVNTLETNDVVTSVNGRTGVVTVDEFDGNYNSLSNKPSLFDGNYNSLDNKPTIPTDLDDLTDNSELLSSGGGLSIEIFYASGTFYKPAGVTMLEITLVGGGAAGGYITAVSSGSDTTITFSSSDSVTAEGGTTRTGTTMPQGTDRYNSTNSSGSGGYLGFDAILANSFNGASYVTQYAFGGQGNGYSGGYGPNTLTPADPRGWGGGGGGGFGTGANQLGGDGAGPSNATLGGQGGPSAGNGKVGGGGSGGSASAVQYLNAQAGGGGAGAGGGAWMFKSGSGSYSTYSHVGGGNAGQVVTFLKEVPTAQAEYTITIGAGGDAVGLYSHTSTLGGGGGQGIVVIKY